MAVSACISPFPAFGAVGRTRRAPPPNRSFVGHTSMNDSSKDEELSIRITIPPKPAGMNPGPYPTTDSVDNNVDSQSQIFQFSSASKTSSVASSSGGIGLKGLLSEEEDLASSKLPFVWKLYEMLEEVETKGQQDIVSWVQEGKAFKVHKMNLFVNEIIPKYFRQSKYKSFQRQLYFYDFHRIQEGPDAGAYQHPNFVKGVKTMCLTMLPKKHSGTKRQSDQAKESHGSTLQQRQSNQRGGLQPEAKREYHQQTRTPDPSEWLTQMESLMTHGPISGNVSHAQARRRSSASDDHRSSIDERSLQPAGPTDGDTVFVFGGKPFHFTDVSFDDL